MSLDLTTNTLACMHATLLQSYPTRGDPKDSSPPGFCLQDSPVKNTGVGCHILLQGILLTQGLNLISYLSCMAGRFFTTSTTWEVFNKYSWSNSNSSSLSPFCPSVSCFLSIFLKTFTQCIHALILQTIRNRKMN